MVLVSYKPINPIVLASLIVIVMHFLQAGRKRATLPGTEESMTTTIDFITALFYEVDEQLGAIPKHPEARLWPSEVVTLGLLHALKGVGNRAFYRWLTRDYRPWFPQLPERTRLFRLFTMHQDWTQVFLAAPTVLGVIDSRASCPSRWRNLVCKIPMSFLGLSATNTIGYTSRGFR